MFLSHGGGPDELPGAVRQHVRAALQRRGQPGARPDVPGALGGVGTCPSWTCAWGCCGHFSKPLENAPTRSRSLVSTVRVGFRAQVYTALLERGFRVMPQVKAGSFRIDMVVEGATTPGWPSSAMATSSTGPTAGRTTWAASACSSAPAGRSGAALPPPGRAQGRGLGGTAAAPGGDGHRAVGCYPAGASRSWKSELLQSLPWRMQHTSALRQRGMCHRLPKSRLHLTAGQS